MADADLFAQNGTTGDFVSTFQNVTGAPGHTPIFEVNPDRGLFIRLANQVASGQEIGVPVYFKLRDTNSNALPASTSAYFTMQVAGQEQAQKVSAKRATIQHWNSNTISEQRDDDNIDAAKFVLQRPETSPTSEPVNALEVRDVDALRLEIDSSAQIDWSNSELYVDSNATTKGSLDRRA